MSEDKSKDEAKENGKDSKIEFSVEQPVIVDHEFGKGKKKFGYTTVTGRMPLYNEKDEIVSQMFYIAYLKNGVDDVSKRPLLFSFNGGPGSPSLWLHLGALGPKRVQMEPDGWMPQPPYKLVDNEHTWLEHADLVFIDPIGTGFSRARSDEESEKAWDVKGDIETIGEFVRMFLTKNKRWTSPLFVTGESYGTYRAAGLASHLYDRGIAFNGLVLVSTVLNMQSHRFMVGNDLPYPLFLPTYAATAHYHGVVGKGKKIEKFVREVEAWAETDYASALMLGDRLPAKTRKAVIEKLVEYTGLSPDFIENSDLRIHIWRFCKELLRSKKTTVGRLDSRFTGIDRLAVYEHPEHDPSMSELMPPYTATFNQYVTETLGYETHLNYEIFKGVKKPWNWGSAGEGYPDTSEGLRSAMSKNRHLKVMVASGYYDLATPHFATEYTLSHMQLQPDRRKNISVFEYESGHMMYIHEPSLEKLTADFSTWMKTSLPS